MCDFNVIKSEDHEWRFGKLDQAICRWLTENVGSEWNTIEAKFSERNININVVVFARLGNLLSKGLECAIKLGTTSSFVLLSLKLLFIAKSGLSFSVSSLIELDVGSFAVKLNILGFLLSNHNGVLEMYVDDDNQLVLTRLEEEMLDVAEEDVDSMLGVDWR